MKRDAATQAPDRIARVESRPARPPGVGAKHFRDMGRALRRMVDCHRRLVDLGYPLLQPVEADPAPMDAPRAKKPRRPAMIYPPIDGVPPVDTTTRSEAWTLGDGSVVVLVDGKSGGVHLSHIEVLP